MANENIPLRKVEKEIQKVEAIRIIAIPKSIKAFCVKPYLENKSNMPPPHYNSRNSGLDYKA